MGIGNWELLIMKKLFCVLLCLCLILGCATPQKEGPSVQHGFSTALGGLGYLLLSPIQIAAGLLEGIASLPYYLSTQLQTINQGLVNAQADITLDNTYESAYGKHLSEVPQSGNTGVVFFNMKQATQFFQQVLKQYGISDSEHYILTNIDESSGEYSLLAVIYRSVETIEVIDKYDGKTIHSFSIDERLFYEPYLKDTKGNTLDTIIDWAALSKESIQTQKAQAILITLAANSVLNEKRTPEYWEIEKRWLAGEARDVIKQRSEDIKKRMGVN
ncbi:MAG: hypothetical protein DRQ49_01310 [Gammaproteobacteria bacterium]|nr:MAG: hypothetical protein DRQ41_11330 [Gammaproteobacteria bacterium]RKZ42633.1 MAG: hypothetical protein DRQ49_01310 [Gammaproteobacteria bacterium]RKZ76673.1 MAG: hypothetical protein DRQ57_02900 [Gammaproteobacteria bacterium]